MTDAVLNAKSLIDRIENHYQFDCEAGPLKNCVEWQRLKDAIETIEAALQKPRKNSASQANRLTMPEISMSELGSLPCTGPPLMTDAVREVIARALCAAVHPARCATPDYWNHFIHPDDKVAFNREADALLSSLREGGWAIARREPTAAEDIERTFDQQHERHLQRQHTERTKRQDNGR